MPYINAGVKASIDEGRSPFTAGELNYKLTSLCLKYLEGRLSYNTLNEIVGALECCKQEFYRRLCGPYEDKAIERNGDVYPKELIG